MKAISYLYRLFYFYLFGGVKYARMLGVKVGRDSRIYTFSWGSEPFLISIGNKVTITSGVKILTHDGSTWLFHDKNNTRYQKYGKVQIGNEVFIGVNSIILPGITIGDRVIIGAGSVITRDLESNSVYAGVPAKKICSYDSYREKIEAECVSNSEIERYRNDYYSFVNKAIEISNEKKT